MFRRRDHGNVTGPSSPLDTQSLHSSEDSHQHPPQGLLLETLNNRPSRSPFEDPSSASPNTIDRFENNIPDAAASSTQRLNHVTSERPTKGARIFRYPVGVTVAVFFGDLILTLLPCLFLILAFQALAVNGQDISSRHANAVEQAAKIGPTVFPIVFAAVVGRLMRTYALWRAERGSSLGILEQLNGSQNMLSAFERAIMLPGLGLVSIFVVLLWALSPIGGQSCLRVLGQGTDSIFGNTTIYYFNNTGSGDYGGFMGASAYSTYSPSMNAVFQAALTSLQLVNGSDIWGNVKIPVLQELDSYKKGIEKDGWYQFDETLYNSSYSSLIGIVTSGLQDGLQTQFNMEASYFNLTCPDPLFFNTTAPEDSEDQFAYGGFAAWAMKTPLLLRGSNESLLFSGFQQSLSPNGYQTNSYMVDSNYNISTASEAGPLPVFNIIYASMGDFDGSLWAYNCTVGTTPVEAHVICNGTACAIDRMRYSQTVAPQTSGWPFPTYSVASPYNLLLWMGTATSNLQSGTVSALDFYMSGSDTPFLLSLDISYTNVSGAYFANRLQSIMNTGWQVSFQNAATAQRPSTNTTGLQLSTNASTVSTFEGGVGYAVSQVSGTTNNISPIYVASKAWISVTVIISFILLFCAIISMYFKYGSRSPDILGYVSSLTRDNPNFEHIPGGDKLDGLARARLMRHVRVQIIDSEPWGGGHITLRNLGYKAGPPQDQRTDSVIR